MGLLLRAGFVRLDLPVGFVVLALRVTRGGTEFAPGRRNPMAGAVPRKMKVWAKGLEPPGVSTNRA
jgi:hypothetical protein